MRGTLFFVLLLLALPAGAVIETYHFASPELEQRFRDLSTELRCPKCQNQNIADSNAPIARDLRVQLHRQLEAGDSDEEIKTFMAARYGDFVLYRPRFSAATALLWLAPAILLVLALVAVGRIVASQRASVSGREATHVEFSEEEQRQLAELLDERGPGS